MALTPERKAYLAVWREKNRERVREAQRKYYEANKEVCDQRVKDSQAKNRDYYSAKSVAWTKENRDRHLETRRVHYAKNSAKDIERVRRRQGRIRQAESLMSKAELVEVQGMYDFCQIFKGFEVDHIIPLNGKTVSGLHVLSNLQVLSIKENRSKRNKFNSEVGHGR